MGRNNHLQNRDLLIYQTGLSGWTFLEGVYTGTNDSVVGFINFFSKFV